MDVSDYTYYVVVTMLGTVFVWGLLLFAVECRRLWRTRKLTKNGND